MTALFQAILVETLNACSRTCWFCKFGQERQDDAVSRMDWPTIRRILENLKDLQYSGRISWYNTNEPLLDRRMPEILRMTRESCPRAFVSLATNGDLLDETMYRDLKQSGLDAIGVSIYDDATFEKARRLADRQMVLIDTRTAGVGSLENRGGLIRQDVPEFERDRRRYRNRSCVRPSTMMVVNPLGQVVLCCADMYGDVVMGDVKTHALEEIWHNERFSFYRHALNEEGRGNLPLCSRCSYSGQGFRPYFPYYGPKPVHRLRDRIRLSLGVLKRSFGAAGLP
jgi:radical SAM protein with 4Fe4S-binding SPASM domain